MEQFKELNELFDLSEIESIELCGEEETIDICVEDTHMFLANGIYTHNSSFNNVVADEQGIGKAIEVYQVADIWWVLTQDPAMQELNQCYITALKNRLGKKGIMLKLQYEPSKCLFKEIEEVSRNEVINAVQAKQLGKGIDLVQTTLRKRSAEKLQV